MEPRTPIERIQTRRHEIRLPGDDALAIRVVVSPYLTTVASIIEVVSGLRRGSPASWHRYVRERAAGLDLTSLDVYGSHIPDFLSQVAAVPRPAISEEIDAIRRTSPDEVRRQLREEYGDEPPPAYAPYKHDPAGALTRLCETLDAYWRRVLEPNWPAMGSLLEREVLRIGVSLATEGPSALLARVSHRLELRGDVLSWDVWPDGSPSTAGSSPLLRDRRLLLCPMCSGPDALWTSLSRDASVMLAYSAPGVGLLWQHPADTTGEALDRLFGRTRAQVLRAVHATATTADVAAELDISSALASHHLTALRDLGLADGTRFGRYVYYRMTTRGRKLWDAIES